VPKGQRLQAARENSDFNLSFLDIMACGLGAVILIFLLVKHNDDRGVVESEILSTQLETLEQDVQKFRVLVEQSAQRNSDVKKLGSELDDQSESSKTVLAALDDRITQQQNENARLQDSIKETQDKKAADFVEGPSGGEDNYLLGLKVEGPRIAILIDSSASMTAEALVDVFRYKVSSPQERSSAPKWQRTKRTARWLLNRLTAVATGSNCKTQRNSVLPLRISISWYPTALPTYRAHSKHWLPCRPPQLMYTSSLTDSRLK